MSVFKRFMILAAIVALVIFQAACDRTVTVVESTQPLNCFACHDDQNTFLVSADQQWNNSTHASGNNLDRGKSASCAGCHSNEGFVQRTNEEVITDDDNPTVIHCFTCHQPHTASNFDLRWTETAMLQNGASFDLKAGNICVACHQARQDVNTYVTDPVTFTSPFWGPHGSTQGDMLIGSNGYEYTSFTYGNTPHRSVTQEGCVDCHMHNSILNTDLGGHSFNMHVIRLDENGIEEEVQNTPACAVCHGNLPDFDRNGVQTEVDSLITTLTGILTSAGLMENDLPKAGVTTSADSAGAVWNLLMARGDHSEGVHNTAYTKGLLNSATMFIQGTLPQSPQVVEAEQQSDPPDLND